MTKEELIKKLKELDRGDKEENHVIADQLLLDYIDDQGVGKAFDQIEKWYA